MKKKRRSREFKNSSKVIDMNDARRERQEKRREQQEKEQQKQDQSTERKLRRMRMLKKKQSRKLWSSSGIGLPSMAMCQSWSHQSRF